jgi:hypothetical protein
LITPSWRITVGADEAKRLAIVCIEVQVLRVESRTRVVLWEARRTKAWADAEGLRANSIDRRVQ